ncbi:AraC family transcriptional regulator [Paenibacillus antibioticophila]|uniref:AraC family transcriptional regulator n=1 Tax=Paenibacillus antibioticophila TaxID=1274374 RepID=A0A919XMP5_9BACL|nr:helix-turn-helix domain-containing protein [Paenibacillus antibioticophila]GIO35837.1 AraC family transcriptional regulator [Paenibacillus antibioticophila]
MRKGRLFYKIFIPILVLGTGLVASFASYIYISTVSSVNERIAGSKQNFISQTRNNLEQQIRTIEYAFDTYSTTTSFSEAVNNPITGQDFIAYRNVNSQLNYIATIGMERANYALISLKHDWQISDGRLSALSRQEKNELLKAYVENKDQSLFWIKTETGIRFVNTLPIYSKNKQAIAFSDISLETLNQAIQTGEDSSVFILNRRGELIYSNYPEEALLTPGQVTSILTSITEGREQTGILSLKELDPHAAPAKLIYAVSDYNNWIYVTLLDQQEISGALKLTKFGIITMSAVLMLLISVVAYILAIFFTRPIRQIKKSLSIDEQAASKNEIETIIQSIDTIVTEKESMESFLKAEMPQLETQLITNLFRNRVSADELAARLPQLGYRQMNDSVFVTMLIQLDHLGEREASKKDILLLAVNKLVEEQIPASQRMLPIVLNDKTQATILRFIGRSEQEIRHQLLEQATILMKNARDYLKVSISIGLSKTYSSLLESKEACEMSKLALHHRLNLGKESIIFYEDISMVVSGPVMLHYPMELESQLFDAIRLGDEEQVSRTLYLLLAEMMKKNKNSLNFEVALVRFVSNLIELEQLLGIEVLLKQDNYTLYHVLLETRNPEEVERMLVEEIIFPMVRSMKDKTNKQFRSLSEQIAVIVRSEYDQELTLEQIGERLHYNPNYLSNIFKKEFGTTFSDYLMNYRLEMAKKWLVETNMTIREIAERLQYHKPQNFIRSFRKKEHVTPGEYRKSRQAV